MKSVEVHNLEDPQLVEFADNARQEVFNLRFQHATGQLENTARMKQAKQDLAKEALRLAGTKLPLKTKFVKREADLFAS